MTEEKADAAGGPPTIDRILSPDELEEFRRGFSNDRMNRLARQAVAGAFPAALPTSELVIAMYFGGRVEDAVGAACSPLSRRERELVIISLMTATPYDPLNLAVHIYWDLMEGLRPDEIAWVQLLTATYRGVDKLTIGTNILSATLRAMRSCLPKTDVDSVFAALASHVTTLTPPVPRTE